MPTFNVTEAEVGTGTAVYAVVHDLKTKNVLVQAYDSVGQIKSCDTRVQDDQVVIISTSTKENGIQDGWRISIVAAD